MAATRMRRTLIAIAAALAVASRVAAQPAPPADGAGSGSAVAAPSDGSNADSGSAAAPVDDFPATIPGLEFVHFTTHIQVHTFGGADLSLPAGFYMDAPTYKKLDDAHRADQDQVTSLTAQNQTYRDAMGGWQPGWITITTVALTCLAAGWYVHDKL